jgi:hypothetical protein
VFRICLALLEVQEFQDSFSVVGVYRFRAYGQWLRKKLDEENIKNKYNLQIYNYLFHFIGNDQF